MAKFWITVLQKLCCQKDTEAKENRIGSYCSNNKGIRNISGNKRSRSRRRKKRKHNIKNVEIVEEGQLKSKRGMSMKEVDCNVKRTHKKHKSKPKGSTKKHTYQNKSKAMLEHRLTVLESPDDSFFYDKNLGSNDHNYDLNDFIKCKLSKRKYQIRSEEKKDDNLFSSSAFSRSKNVLDDANSMSSMVYIEQTKSPVKRKTIMPPKGARKFSQFRKEKNCIVNVDKSTSDWNKIGDVSHLVSSDSSRMSAARGIKRSLIRMNLKNDEWESSNQVGHRIDR